MATFQHGWLNFSHFDMNPFFLWWMYVLRFIKMAMMSRDPGWCLRKVRWTGLANLQSQSEGNILVKCVLIDRTNHSQKSRLWTHCFGNPPANFREIEMGEIFVLVWLCMWYHIIIWIYMICILYTSPNPDDLRDGGRTKHVIKNTPGSWVSPYLRSTWMEHVGWMLTGSAAPKNDSRHSQGETRIYHTSCLNPQDDEAGRFSARWVIVDDWKLKIVGFPLCQMVSLESPCSLCRQYMNLHFSINCGQFCSNGFCKIFRLSQLEVKI